MPPIDSIDVRRILAATALFAAAGVSIWGDLILLSRWDTAPNTWGPMAEWACFLLECTAVWCLLGGVACLAWGSQAPARAMGRFALAKLFPRVGTFRGESAKTSSRETSNESSEPAEDATSESKAVPSRPPLTIARMLVATALFAAAAACMWWRRHLLSMWATPSAPISESQEMVSLLFIAVAFVFLVGGTSYLIWGLRRAVAITAAAGLAAETVYVFYFKYFAWN